jgi:hypothetical protein
MTKISHVHAMAHQGPTHGGRDRLDLKLLGIHVGAPWSGELIAMAWKLENVYIGVDAYTPTHCGRNCWTPDAWQCAVGLQVARERSGGRQDRRRIKART